jgi:hypothetical protein
MGLVTPDASEPKAEAEEVEVEEAPAPVARKTVSARAQARPVKGTPVIRPGAKMAPRAPTRPAVATPVTTPDVQANPDDVAALEAAAQASTKPGYSEFKGLLEVMQSVPDEALRVTLTLQGIEKTKGITPDQILAAVEDRLRLVETEQAKFEEAMTREAEQSVGGSTAKIQRLEDEIKAAEAEIERKRAEQAELGATIQEAQDGIDRARAEFAAAYDVVHANLVAERDLVASHAPSTN